MVTVNKDGEFMVDSFSILLSHALVLIACWRLLSRPDLDDERQEPGAPAKAGAKPDA